MVRAFHVALLGILSGLLVPVVLPARSAADPEPPKEVIDEVLSILRERGIVDDEKYEELVARHHADEARRESLLDRIHWSGDLRGRFENFWYDEDAFGNDPSNRNQLRYRLRVGARADINEWIAASFRITSNQDDKNGHRSENQTLGGNDPDFDPDGIFIDQAFLTVNPGGGKWFGDGTTLLADVGKVPNPLIWKYGRDWMVWDNDINPEGVDLRLRTKPSDAISLFANAGYFIIDENSSSADPHVLALQGGIEAKPAKQWELGGRGTYYAFRSLDTGFDGRGASFGNTAGGLTEGSELTAAEFYGYARWSGFASWPVLLYGSWAHNLDAQTVGGADKEDDGFGVGLEVGDKKKFAQLGVGYWYVEANFWPAQYTDSDLFDGFTNRKGFAFYGGREVFTNTELNLTLFLGDAIDEGPPAFDTSLHGADRLRLMTDLVVKF